MYQQYNEIKIKYNSFVFSLRVRTRAFILIIAKSSLVTNGSTQSTVQLQI